VTKQSEEQQAANAKSEAKPAEADKGAVNVSSIPSGADVLLDGNFVGNSPAALKLPAGKHTITVKMSGYADWTREISVQSASEVQLTTTLEKIP
jgi:hypothetical protein